MTSNRSSCCNATVTVVNQDEGTNYYACDKCKMPCDVASDRSKEWKRRLKIIMGEKYYVGEVNALKKTTQRGLTNYLSKGNMTDKKIIEILKSGDFTLAYHDNGYCNIYRGRFDNYSDLKGSPIELNQFYDGYETPEGVILTMALGGKVVSL